MFGKKTKAPSVKIPKSILKREAQKEAKKILMAEKKKEQNKLKREKIKLKAKKKVQKTKKVAQDTEEYFDSGFQREIYASLFVGLGIMIMAIYLSEAPVSDWLNQNIFEHLFGIIRWIIPLLLIGLGLALLMLKDLIFPPLRVFCFLLFLTSLCGLINLQLPQEESLSLSFKYGGALGFSIDFFLREFLGDIFAFVSLIFLFWISATISFNIRIKALWAWFFETFLASSQKEGEIIREIKIEENTSVKKLKAIPKAKEISEPHFQNEVEIVDSTKTDIKKKKPTPPKKIEIKEENSDLNASINREFGEWEAPDLELLNDNPSTIVVDEKDLRDKAESIREKLAQFGIEVQMKSVHVGPTVTQFTLNPAPGVKVNKITTLKSDLALALAATNVRIEAPIRGKKLVGIEIPNEERAVVSMREILDSDSWVENDANLKLAVGRDVAGKPVTVNLAKMPHLLIAGKTGSGKSVAMNAFLTSLLWNNSPDELRLILIDPKRVELELYNNLPHLLTPVIVNSDKAVSALAWAVAEMNRRYKDLAKKRCRNIAEHNERYPDEKESYIVIVIDELADLMMVAGKDVEAAICRLAQMARAVGMHLIVATQRPSVDVVTGLIKANLPARIAFRVSSGIDSRTIIDGIGAEDLLGFGDMLYLDGNSGELKRIQGLYVTDTEVEKITNHIKLQFPEMIANDEITEQSIDGMAKGGVLTAGLKPTEDSDLDSLYEKAVDLAIETGKASASLFQRRLEVGYARAARIIDQMESKGVVGQARGAKPREVYGRQE